MRHRRTLSSLLLALILLIGAAPTGRASEGPRVLYESQGSSALLALDGLGEGSVYAAQVELTLSGRYTSASFTPAGETAFSPDCRLTVQGEDTLVTFYITSVSPLNNEHDLPLGTLTLDESFSLPSQAVVTLLDRELKAFPGLQRSTLSTRAATLSAPTGSGSSGGSSVRVRRKVIVRDSDHGRVRTDMGQARSGDTVTLTVEPEEGYLLDKLNVVSVKGREISLFVGEDRFTFRMPDADVEVTATFLPIGKEQESLPFVDVTEEDWFCDPVSYVYQEEALGLGHAVRCAAEACAGEPFYVLLGDVLVPDNKMLPAMKAVSDAHGGASVIAVMPVPDDEVSRFGVIAGAAVADDVWKVDSLVEKPALEDAPSNLAVFGRYLLSPRVMELLADVEPGVGGEIQLTDALDAVLAEEELYALVVDPADGFDTGTVESWLETNNILFQRKNG